MDETERPAPPPEGRRGWAPPPMARRPPPPHDGCAHCPAGRVDAFFFGAGEWVARAAAIECPVVEAELARILRPPI